MLPCSKISSAASPPGRVFLTPVAGLGSQSLSSLRLMRRSSASTLLTCSSALPRHVPTGLWVCADLVALPFADASFDAVCSYYAIIHIPREQHASVLHGLARVLRPRGLALLCLGAVDLPAWTEQYHDAPMYWSHYDAATSLSLVKAAGLEVVWDRWVAEGAGGHLFVLAQRYDT